MRKTAPATRETALTLTIHECIKGIQFDLATKQIKNLSNYFSRYSLNPQILTTIFELGIISKNKPYEWNDDFLPDLTTSILIEEQSRFYQPIIASISTFRNISDIHEGFNVDFRFIWPRIGFARQFTAKRSLLRYFKENKDFCIHPAVQVQNELPGLTGDYENNAEIIMLTLQCSLDFLTTVNMPMAKFFARKMNAFMVDKAKIGALSEQKGNSLSVYSKIEQDIYAAEKICCSYKKSLYDQFRKNAANFQNLTFPFFSDTFFERRKQILNEIIELYTRNYQFDQLQLSPNTEIPSLPYGSSDLCQPQNTFNQ